MKARVIFLVSWITAAALVFVLGDHNTYLVYADGHKKLKDRATIAEKVIGSVLEGALCGLVSTLCVVGSQKIFVFLGSRRRLRGSVVNSKATRSENS